MEAAHALGTRGGEGVAARLQWAAAADSDQHVIRAAIEALGRLASRDAVAALLALAADPLRRDDAIRALARAGGHSQEVALGLSDPQPTIRRAAVEALGQMRRPDATRVLIAALDHQDAAVRAAACTALARLGTRDAERKLALLAGSDPAPSVRRAA